MEAGYDEKNIGPRILKKSAEGHLAKRFNYETFNGVLDNHSPAPAVKSPLYWSKMLVVAVILIGLLLLRLHPGAPTNSRSSS